MSNLSSFNLNLEGIKVGEDLPIQYRMSSGVTITDQTLRNTRALSACCDDEAFSTVIAVMPLNDHQNYFEVEITNEGNNSIFAVGFGPLKCPFNTMPGWIEGSIGYHADGNIFIEQGDVPIKGPRCGKGDRMGCGVDFSTAAEGYVQVWFTKNGRLAWWPEKVQANPKVAFQPLISVGNSGEVVHHFDHNQLQQEIPDISSLLHYVSKCDFMPLHWS